MFASDALQPIRFNAVEDLSAQQVIIGVRGKLPPIRKMVWIPRNHRSTPGTYCSICLFDSTNFHSACGHDFHLQCIVEWSKRNSICPNCRAVMESRDHAVYCSGCCEQEMILDFRTMMQRGQSGLKEEESRCEECRAREKEEAREKESIYSF